MLKKLFASAILLFVTVSANATLMNSINGTFDFFGIGKTTLNADGEVQKIDFSLNNRLYPVLLEGTYADELSTTDTFSVVNPLLFANILGKDLWSIGGFTFNATSIAENGTDKNGATGLSIIGDVSHDKFITTSTLWFISSQFLTLDGTSIKSFSSSIISPDPASVSAPATITILGLALVGFGVARRKKQA